MQAFRAKRMPAQKVYPSKGLSRMQCSAMCAQVVTCATSPANSKGQHNPEFLQQSQPPTQVTVQLCHMYNLTQSVCHAYTHNGQPKLHGQSIVLGPNPTWIQLDA
jgi:cytochrome c5